MSAGRLELSIALSDNPNTRPLLDGAVHAEGISLIATALHPSEMFWRQLRFAEFDVSEMSMSSLLIATSRGPTPWVALPVFTTREFFHTRILVRGELDATLLYLTHRNLVDRSRLDLSRDPRIRPLFVDRGAEARRYYAKTGLYQINHTVVVRRTLVERHPWIALNLFSAFMAAKNAGVDAGNAYLAPFFSVGALGDDVRRALAGDPMAYGVKAARPVLETIAQYVHEQGLSERRVALEEIFAPSTLDL
ncbi:MAG: hypothetical protein ACJ8ES_09425 [Xanthobacteraceae bacterium]